MKKLRVFCCLVLTFVLLSLPIFGQKVSLPRFKKGEAYKSVRFKLLKAGWKPYHSPSADKCMKGDERCVNRPEMESCAGTGMANCKFLWKRRDQTVAIFTVGEDAVYDNYEVE